MTDIEKFNIFLFFKTLTTDIGYTFESFSFEEDENYTEGYDLEELSSMSDLSFHLYGENTSIGIVINFDNNTWFPAYDAFYMIGKAKNITLDDETREKFKNLIQLLLSE
jgi:hypothetical protein